MLKVKNNYYHKANRLIIMFSMSLLILFVCTHQVYAVENDAYITEMNNIMWSWFLQIRNHIAPPLLALSFAICGMRILGSSFQSKGSQVIDAVKSQLFLSSIALIILIALPTIISAAKGIFANSAWSPPDTSHLFDEATSTSHPLAPGAAKAVSDIAVASTSAVQP